jgi:hypothetical protein
MKNWRMPSSGMWRRVDLMWTDVSEERIVSIFSLQPPAHAGSSLADFSTLKMETIRSSETSVHTRSTRRHIPEDGILHSHRCENLESYLRKIVVKNFVTYTRIILLSLSSSMGWELGHLLAHCGLIRHAVSSRIPSSSWFIILWYIYLFLCILSTCSFKLVLYLIFFSNK